MTASIATPGGSSGGGCGGEAGTTEQRPSPWCYVKLGWVDEVTQPILPDLDRAFACIGAWVDMLLVSVGPGLWVSGVGLVCVRLMACRRPYAMPRTEEARRRGGACLVFCKKGMSRSGAVVVAYLMTTQVCMKGWTYIYMCVGLLVRDWAAASDEWKKKKKDRGPPPHTNVTGHKNVRKRREEEPRPIIIHIKH